MIDFCQARDHMVEGQLRPNLVRNPLLLQAMGEIPRERFVPKNRTNLAYADADLPLTRSRVMLAPLKLARLIEALNLTPQSMVLDVGCATGYSCAVLARLAAAIVAIEPDKGLREAASKNLQDMGDDNGCDNVAIFPASLQAGWPDQAPYDAILIAGSVGRIPKSLVNQLALGGYLATILYQQQASTLRVYRKTATGMDPFDLWEISAPPLPGLEPRQAFVF